MNKPGCDCCKHCALDPKYKTAMHYARCMAPPALEGKRPHFASVNRSFYGLCGPEGKFFEAVAA